MKEIIIAAGFCTVLVILIIFIIGRLIDIINDCLILFMSKKIGSGFALFIANWLTFVGTVHHELSHAFIAFITGAKIKKISLFHPNGNSLGSVEFATRGNAITKSIQLSLSAIAPMVIGTFSECLLWTFLQKHELSIGITILLYYVMVSIFLHMTMSMADIKCALKGLPVCLVLLFIIWIFVILFGDELFVNMIFDCCRAVRLL